MEEQLAEIFLRSSIDRLGRMSDYIKTCLGRLTDEQIWNRQGGHDNAVGNLILHLCGNARQWIIAGVAGASDARDRDAEFSARGDWTGAQLLTYLRDTVREALTVIEALTPQRLTETVTPQGYSLSVMEAIYQVTGHFHQHAGQIIFITKLLSEENLVLFTRSERADNRSPF